MMHDRKLIDFCETQVGMWHTVQPDDLILDCRVHDVHSHV